MALQSAGNTISFNDIKNEFGAPPENKFGNYRISETVGQLQNLPLDTGIPQTGIISFSNFYSKKQNIIVDLFSGNTEQRVVAKTKYNQDSVVVLGGGDRPDDTSGKKIIVHVNKTVRSIYSNGTDNKKCALRTGNWDTGTDFTINVGTNGVIGGTGGNGGNGGPAGNNNGQPGDAGTSAIGINDNNLSVSIVNNGAIRAGYGGGGGGSGRSLNVKVGKKSSQNRTSTGGGGGGGAGIPAPSDGGTASENANWENGENGDPGQATQGGDGGAGGEYAGNGGHGGDPSNLVNAGASDERAPSGTAPGDPTAAIGGESGYAVLRISGAPAPSLSGNNLVGRNSVGTPT